MLLLGFSLMLLLLWDMGRVLSMVEGHISLVMGASAILHRYLSHGGKESRARQKELMQVLRNQFMIRLMKVQCEEALALDQVS